MLQLNLPAFPCKVQEKQGKLYIYDALRRKQVMLTPEEWVRQHVIHYLTTEAGIPLSRLRIESNVAGAAMQRRCDLIAYNAELQPYVLVECKAPHIPLDERETLQLALYQRQVSAKYILLTNGMEHRLFEREGEGWKRLDDLSELKVNE